MGSTIAPTGFLHAAATILVIHALFMSLMAFFHTRTIYLSGRQIRRLSDERHPSIPPLPGIREVGARKTRALSEVSKLSLTMQIRICKIRQITLKDIKVSK